MLGAGRGHPVSVIEPENHLRRGIVHRRGVISVFGNEKFDGARPDAGGLSR